MANEIDWRAIEDASPENRQLGEILRRVEGIYGGNPPLDWKESRRRCVEVLTAELNSPANKSPLAERLEDREYEIGGDEHLVIRLEEDAGRVYKLTHGDSFGCRAFFSRFDPEGSGKHFHGTINEDPAFYLRRWMLLNLIGEYQTRFEGFLPPDGSLRMPRICVSQPTLDVASPSRPEIEEALGRFGFMRVSLDAFLNFESHILLTDAAPRNVRIAGGSIALFDAIASIADEGICSWAEGLSISPG